MSSQVVTFYEDKEMTKAILPRTKISAISDNSGTALSEMVLYHGDGIDSPRALIDADLLQGHNASYFTPKSDFDNKVEELNTAIVNSGKFYGIDTSNILATSTSLASYTATQDCYILFTVGSNIGVYLNNIRILDGQSYNPSYNYGCVPLKANDVIAFDNAPGSFKVFGIKE